MGTNEICIRRCFFGGRFAAFKTVHRTNASPSRARGKISDFIQVHNVGGPHMVTLLKLFHAILPVARQNGGEMGLETHVANVVLGQTLRSRFQIIQERLGIHIHVDVNKAFPSFAANGHESYFAFLNTTGRKILGPWQMRNFTVQVPCPAMKYTPEFAFIHVTEITCCPAAAPPVLAFDQTRSPMHANIVIGLKALIFITNNNNGLITNFIFKIVSHLGDFFLTACPLPNSRPEKLVFFL